MSRDRHDRNRQRRIARRLNKLRPFAEHLSEMHCAIEDMSDRELKFLIMACDEPTRTNCWSMIYRVGPIVRNMAREELSIRRTSNRVVRRTS